jgi:hypothetical protein
VRITRMVRADLTRQASTAGNGMITVKQGIDTEMRNEIIIGVAPYIDVNLEAMLIAVEASDCNCNVGMNLCLCDGDDTDEPLECTLSRKLKHDPVVSSHEGVC